MRYRVILSYDGSKFNGWQIQNEAPSVQESLQKSLSTLLGSETAVTGAGRTDSRVNAINYAAHFDAPDGIDTAQLCYKLNAILPAGIVAHEVSETPAGFHARFDAKSRQYMYFLNRRRDPFAEKFSYRFSFPIDVEAMNEAARMIVGTRDFSCFEKVGGNNKTSICTVTEAYWKTYTPDHMELMGYPGAEGDYLVFTISADRFLRNMVRAVVGTLLEIGRGKRPVSWMQEVLSSGDRCAAGDSVPGHALFLTKVDY